MTDVEELATTLEVANRLLHGDYLILDTRSASEYEGCRVIGSISCPPPASFLADFNKATFSLSDVGLCLSANDHKYFMGEHREGQKILIGINGSPSSSNRTDPWALRLFELLSIRATKATAARAAAKERTRMLSRGASSKNRATRQETASGSGSGSGSVGPSTPPRGKHMSPMKMATQSTSPVRQSQGSLSDSSPRGSVSVVSHSSLFETASDGLLASRSSSSDESLSADHKSGPVPWRRLGAADAAGDDIAYGRAWCANGYDPPSVRFLSLPLLFEKAPMLWCPAGLLVTSKQFFAQPSCILDGFLYLSDQCAAADPRVCGPQGTLRPSHIVNVTNRKATNYFEGSPAPGRAERPSAAAAATPGPASVRAQQMDSPAKGAQPRALNGAFRAEEGGIHRTPLMQPPSADKRTAQNIMDSILASASASAGSTPRGKAPVHVAAATAPAGGPSPAKGASMLPPPAPRSCGANPVLSTPPRRPSGTTMAAAGGSRSPCGARTAVASAAMGSPQHTPTRSHRRPSSAPTQGGKGVMSADDGPPLLTLDYWDQQDEDDCANADRATDASRRGSSEGSGGVAYLNVALWDSVHADITPHLETAYAFIEECRRHNLRIAEEEAVEAAAAAAFINAHAHANGRGTAGVAPTQGAEPMPDTSVPPTDTPNESLLSWLQFPPTLTGLLSAPPGGEERGRTAAKDGAAGHPDDSEEPARTEIGGAAPYLLRRMLAASGTAPHTQRRQPARQPQRVLVHCAMGISRSPALLIYYVMKSQRLSLREAYNYVKFCRPETFPNRAFMLQLIEAERRLYPELAANGWETSITVHDLGKIGGLLSDYQSKTETSVGLVATGSDRGQHIGGSGNSVVGTRRDGTLSNYVALLCEGSSTNKLRSPARDNSRGGSSCVTS